MIKIQKERIWVSADFKRLLKKKAADKNKSMLKLTHEIGLCNNDPFDELVKPTKKNVKTFKFF
jgi:hypothetical protein